MNARERRAERKAAIAAADIMSPPGKEMGWVTALSLVMRVRWLWLVLGTVGVLLGASLFLIPTPAPTPTECTGGFPGPPVCRGGEESAFSQVRPILMILLSMGLYLELVFQSIFVWTLRLGAIEEAPCKVCGQPAAPTEATPCHGKRVKLPFSGIDRIFTAARQRAANRSLWPWPGIALAIVAVLSNVLMILGDVMTSREWQCTTQGFSRACQFETVGPPWAILANDWAFIGFLLPVIAYSILMQYRILHPKAPRRKPDGEFTAPPGGW